MIYLIIFILLVILAIVFDFCDSKKKYESIWYNVVLIIFIAVSGLRYKVGGDSFAYMASFKDVPFLWQLKNFSFSEAQYDPLWIIFSSFSKSIINDFIFFQIIHAIVVNLVVFRFIKANTAYRFTSVLLYAFFLFLYFNMEIMRESLAICVFLLSYPYLKKKKWLFFYIFSGIAFLFHSSAIILFIFPILYNIKFKPLTILVLISIFILIVVIPDTLKIIFSSILFNDRLSSRFNEYSAYKLNFKGVLLAVGMYIIYPSVLIYFNRRLGFKTPFTDLYFIYIFIVIITIGFSGFSRFLNYLTPFMAVYFAAFINNLYRFRYLFQVKRITAFTLLIITVSFKIGYYFSDTSDVVYGTRRYDAWYPYNSIFFKEENYKRQQLYEGLTDPD